MHMFFVLCIQLLKLKTERQTIYRKPHLLLQKSNQTEILPFPGLANRALKNLAQELRF